MEFRNNLVVLVELKNFGEFGQFLGVWFRVIVNRPESQSRRLSVEFKIGHIVPSANRFEKIIAHTGNYTSHPSIPETFGFNFSPAKFN